MIEYKTEWKANQSNKEFWTEVLVGRTIKDLEYNEKGIVCLVLDNGEKFYQNQKTPNWIKTEEHEEITKNPTTDITKEVSKEDVILKINPVKLMEAAKEFAKQANFASKKGTKKFSVVMRVPGNEEYILEWDSLKDPINLKTLEEINPKVGPISGEPIQISVESSMSRHR